MKQEVIHPEGWAPAKGYANGVLVTGGGPTLYVAGQVAWDADQQLVGAGDMGAQFAQVLRNVMAVVEAAGGQAEHIVRMAAYVTDKQAYMDATKPIGAAWRELIGRHFPAMALVEVAALLEAGAMVEIEATAVLPPA